MGESALLQALIAGYIGLLTASTLAGGVASFTFRNLAKITADLADRVKITADERDEASKGKTTEMEARAAATIQLADALHEVAKIRNELTVVSSNASRMDEAMRVMGERMSKVEDEKSTVEKERDALKIENTALIAENMGLTTERDQMQSQIDQLKAEVRDLKVKVKALETQNHPEIPADIPVAASESADHVAQLTGAGVAIELTKDTKPKGSNPL